MLPLPNKNHSLFTNKRIVDIKSREKQSQKDEHVALEIAGIKKPLT